MPRSAIAATAGRVLIATLAFVLSFTALTDLARTHGVPPGQAWMIPAIVDTTILVATAAVVTLQAGRWYARLLLVVSAALSVAGNITHAVGYGAVAVVVAAVPPLALLAMTELVVLLLRRPDPPTVAEVAADARPRAPELIARGDRSLFSSCP